MALSLPQQLKKALAEGDIERAKEIAAKLAPSKPKKNTAPKKAPSKPSKATPAPKVKRVIEDPVDLTAGQPEPLQDEPLILTLDQLRNGRSQRVLGPGEYRMPDAKPRVDKDGRVRVQSRRVSMAGDMPKVVPAKDNGWGGVSPDVAAFDKANGRRTDADISYRPTVRKVKVDCDGCRKAFIVWESALSSRTDEDMTTEWFYRCSRCCKAGR